MRDEVGALGVFVGVAEKRSFRAAAEELGVTSSAVSQTLKQLEEQLGLQLLVRTTRSVGLTDAGEQLYSRLAPAFMEVRAALEALSELRQRPAGALRLVVSSIAEGFLTEATLAGFLRQYPDIRLDICLDDGPADLVLQGFDAGVRLGEVVGQDMVTVSVSGPQRQVVVGSPEYFAAHGKPRHPRELHAHACIGWRHYANPAPYRWEFTEDGRDFELSIEARVNTNDKSLMQQLARQGVGLSIGMEEYFRPQIERGELVTVLDAFCPPFPGFFLYYPSRSHMPKKLAALVEYLRARAKPRRASAPRRARA
jgi:DNA-binding transcriptional LysR family regulator